MSDLNSKVVFTALSRLTNDRSVIKQAFNHWQNEFAGKPLDVFAVVENLQGFLGLGTAEKKILMVSMHSATSKNESDLMSIPAFIVDGAEVASASAPSTDASSAEAKKAASGKPPYVALAEFYYSHIIDGARRAGGKLSSEMLEILRDEGLSGLANIASVFRKADDQVSLPSDFSEKDSQTFCHELYMLLCEVAGPMAADDISYKAITKMMETNEASRYDPKNLI